MKYVKPKENEWVQPIRKGHKMMCCDCGLVHDMDFRLVPRVNGQGQFIQFRGRRNKRSTAQARRRLGIVMKYKEDI